MKTEKNKKRVNLKVTVILSLLSVLSVYSQTNPEIEKKEPRIRKHVNRAFSVGEHLVFNIDYGIIHAGEARMSIPDTQWVNGRPCYHVVTTAKSNKFFDPFFKVRDRVETFIDMEGIFPWKFKKKIHEGRYRKKRVIIYDQLNNRVFYKKDTIDVPPNIQGVLSSFYFIRTTPLKVGRPVFIENFSEGKIYKLKILVHKKEHVRVPAGEFDCIVVEPILKYEGIFKQKGRIVIWLTDDEKRMPVLMKSKALIGTIVVRLKNYRFNRYIREKK